MKTTVLMAAALLCAAIAAKADVDWLSREFPAIACDSGSYTTPIAVTSCDKATVSAVIAVWNNTCDDLVPTPRELEKAGGCFILKYNRDCIAKVPPSRVEEVTGDSCCLLSGVRWYRVCFPCVDLQKGTISVFLKIDNEDFFAYLVMKDGKPCVKVEPPPGPTLTAAKYVDGLVFVQWSGCSAGWELWGTPQLYPPCWEKLVVICNEKPGGYVAPIKECRHRFFKLVPPR